MKRLKKIALWGGVGLAVVALLVLVAGYIASEPRPEGSPDGAEALTARVEAAVNVEAWEQTGAVRWTFAGRHEHLWDREGEMAQVLWDDVDARLRLDRSASRITRGGVEVTGEEANALADEAYSYFINDSFWLNPLAKLRDEGVTRSVVSVDGADALLIEYSSGGLTPGDAYLWLLSDDGTPRAWRMWVSIIPIGGIEASWDGWTELSTGARVSTLHETAAGVTLELTGVEGAAALSDLIEGPDPFDSLRR